MRSEGLEETTEEKPGKSFAELRESGMKYAPDSSNIELCTYAPYEGILLIDFKSGATYLYRDVTEELWSELTRAESAGRYFQKYIRHLPYERVVKDEEGKEMANGLF